jgi:molecular chaperone DnaJ
MDLYIILGVTREATLNDIKRAYKRLARRYHPDINPGDSQAAEQFRQIAEAYETLSDPDRRRGYDATGRRPAAAQDESAFGFEGFDFSVSGGGADEPTFGDLFADVLHQREATGRRAASERGSDLHYPLTMTFEEAARGGQRAIAVTRQEHCRRCKGNGLLQAEGACTFCRGEGTVKSARGHMVFTRPCSHCGGTGQRRPTRCPACDGQQVEMRAETVQVNLPAGLADGARVRVPGKGHGGRNGGEHGDLFITLQVLPHEHFRREGDDLVVVVPIAIHEAALGAKVTVPALDGPARLRVPPGTQSGQRFRVHERGLPSPKDGRRGDLIVEARIVLPRVLDERSKELLRQFGEINNQDVRRS